MFFSGLGLLAEHVVMPLARLRNCTSYHTTRAKHGLVSCRAYRVWRSPRAFPVDS